MADKVNVVNELNTIDEHGNNVINRFSTTWDFVQNKPILREFMLGEIIDFPRKLTPQEEEAYMVLPMDGRELENVEPYRELYAFLVSYGDGPFPAILENMQEYKYIQYGPVGETWELLPVLSLKTSGVAFTANITANFDSSIQPQDKTGWIDWPDGTNTRISANGTFTKAVSASVGIVNVFGNMTRLQVGSTFRGSILGGDTSKLTNMDNMFNYCTTLTGSIPNFNTCNVTNMSEMFHNCYNLTGSIPKFNTTKVTSMSVMFRSCTNLTGLIPDFNTINVTNMWNMFSYCSNLTGPIPNFNMNNVWNTANMFQSCTRLTGSIPNFNTSNVRNMQGMFYNCSNLTGSIPNFNTSNVTNMGYMFNYCSNLTGSIPNWNTSNVLRMECMFYNCNNLIGQIPDWDIIKVTNMQNMFYNCTNLTGYNLFTGTWAQGKGTA